MVGIQKLYLKICSSYRCPIYAIKKES